MSECVKFNDLIKIKDTHELFMCEMQTTGSDRPVHEADTVDSILKRDVGECEASFFRLTSSMPSSSVMSLSDVGECQASFFRLASSVPCNLVMSFSDVGEGQASFFRLTSSMPPSLVLSFSDVGECQASFFRLTSSMPPSLVMSFSDVGECQASFFRLASSMPCNLVMSFSHVGECQASFFRLTSSMPSNLIMSGSVKPYQVCTARTAVLTLLYPAPDGSRKFGVHCQGYTESELLCLATHGYISDPRLARNGFMLSNIQRFQDIPLR
ncbi:hypothetical protein RRG08_039581 [Elysia crispata]|uniref:Uncharacterized protein n=1 Tax=Elysia crispata TaxID=231223 RepID=A0AAE1AZU3_9GAST|nr:hypothetical protein RRG08_039581 [Elysia crispata]